MLKMEKKDHYCIILQYYIFITERRRPPAFVFSDPIAGKTNRTGSFDWSVNMKL